MTICFANYCFIYFIGCVIKVTLVCVVITSKSINLHYKFGPVSLGLKPLTRLSTIMFANQRVWLD